MRRIAWMELTLDARANPAALSQADLERLRFVSDDQGTVVAIEGVYLDGRTDRNDRDH